MKVVAAVSAERGMPSVLAVPLDELIIGLIAFLIVFGALGKFALPKIKATLDERADAIEGGLQRAEEAQAEASRVLEEYKERLHRHVRKRRPFEPKPRPTARRWWRKPRTRHDRRPPSHAAAEAQMAADRPRR